MTVTLDLILLIVAAVLAFLAAFGVPVTRVGLFPLAFALFVVTLITP